MKRKSAPQGNESDSPEIDISSALAPKQQLEDTDDGLHQMIQASIAKRNVKRGTQVVKKTKGNAHITKGEVGGGSFQSMGMCIAK